MAIDANKLHELDKRTELILEHVKSSNDKMDSLAETVNGKIDALAGVVKDHVDDDAKRLGNLDESIRGDGKGQQGILSRIQSLEGFRSRLCYIGGVIVAVFTSAILALFNRHIDR